MKSVLFFVSLVIIIPSVHAMEKFVFINGTNFMVSDGQLIPFGGRTTRSQRLGVCKYVLNSNENIEKAGENERTKGQCCTFAEVTSFKESHFSEPHEELSDAAKCLESQCNEDQLPEAKTKEN